VRRRLLIVAAFLLAGAVVNVAVAWGCAVLVDFTVAQSEVGGAKGSAHDWVIWHHDARAALRIRALATSGNVDEHEQYPQHSWMLPSWGPLAVQVRLQQEDEPFLRIADAYGWPRYSMWSAFGWDTAHWPNVMIDPRWSAILVESPMGRNYGETLRALPLRPIWAGFALNTLFYAAILWLLICGPLALRRFTRVKRGLCPGCAYPRGELNLCSECGKALVVGGSMS